MPVPDELDSFAEFSSDRFRNLDEVVEFHDNTAEFPMDVETDSAVLAGPLEGTAETEEVEVKEGTEGTEEVKREKELSDRNAKEFIKNATNISSAQALAPVAVALVVTSAIVVPFIENMDVEVNLNMEFVAGILSYSIEIINGSEDEVYEAFVYEGSSIIKETVIENGQLTDSIGGLPPYKEHRVEVRSGSPALYVLETSTIPAAPSWAEWGHLTVGFDVIDYGVYYYGNSGEATITLEDPYDETILYSKALEEGFNSDIITGLRSSHLYTLTVVSDSTLYLYEELETEYSDVEWDHLTIIDNTIDYGVISDYSIENLTISLYDPDTSSVVYTKELLQGYDSDTIVDLQFGHAYELTVATEEEIYLFETVVTDSEPVTVTVGHITPVNNTIDYEITVSGEGKTLTLNLYDIAGGPPVFTATLKSGVNNKIIEGLQYSHSYLLTVTSSTKTYVSESVTTETEPTKATLGHLKATQTTVDYEVTVTGNRDVATAYLKDPTSGRVLYSKELKVGVNSAIIERLEVDHTYQFTVSSKTETFINQNITTDPKQTEVVLNHLKVVDNTIDYEVTVSGSSDTVAAHLYDIEGTELYSVPLSIGSNTGVIRDLEYGSTYQFTVSSETKRYVESAVTIEYDPTEVVLNDLSTNENTISYDVTVIGTSDILTAYLYDDNGTELYSKVLEEGTNTAEIGDLEYQQTYDFTISSEERIYINETILIETQKTVVTVNSLEMVDHEIRYDVTVEGDTDKLAAYVFIGEEEWDSEDLDEGNTQDYSWIQDPDITYLFEVRSTITGEVYYSKEVKTSYIVIMEGFRNTIKYNITLPGSEDALLYFDYYDSYPIELLANGEPNIGVFAGTSDEPLSWWTLYNYEIRIGDEVVYSWAVATQAHVEIISNASAVGNVISFELKMLDCVGSDLEISIENRDGEQEVQSYSIPIRTDPRPIEESIGGEDPQGPVIKWGATYILRASILGDTYQIGTVTIDDAVEGLTLVVNGDTIEYECHVNASSASLLFTDLEDEPDPIPLNHGDNSGTFSDVYLGHEYYAIVYVDDEEVCSAGPKEVPFPFDLPTLDIGINSLTYEINAITDLSRYESVLLVLEPEVQGLDPVDLLEEPSGTITDIPDGTYEILGYVDDMFKSFGTVVISSQTTN